MPVGHIKSEILSTPIYPLCPDSLDHSGISLITSNVPSATLVYGSGQIPSLPDAHHFHAVLDEQYRDSAH